MKEIYNSLFQAKMVIAYRLFEKKQKITKKKVKYYYLIKVK